MLSERAQVFGSTRLDALPIVVRPKELRRCGEIAQRSHQSHGKYAACGGKDNDQRNRDNSSRRGRIGEESEDLLRRGEQHDGPAYVWHRGIRNQPIGSTPW